MKRVVLGLKQLRGYDGFITTDRWDAGDVEVGNFNMTNVASHETADNEVVLVVVACMVVVGDEREGNVSTLARVVWNDLALACGMPGMPVGVVHVTALACHAVLLRIMAKGATSVRQTSLELKSLQLKWDPSRSEKGVNNYSGPLPQQSLKPLPHFARLDRQATWALANYARSSVAA